MIVARPYLSRLVYKMRRSLLVIVFTSIVLQLFAQEKQVIQVKTFDQTLQVLRNVEVSVNDKPFISVGGRGVAMLELDPGETIRSIKIKDDKFETASWNLSKGVIEIIVRPKSYKVIQFTLQLSDGTPLSQTSVIYKGSKPISVTTDDNGKFNIPLALSETISAANQFVVGGYLTKKLNMTEQQGTLIVERPVEQKIEPLQKQSISFDPSQLDSIRTLRQFYAVFRMLPIKELDAESRTMIDNKFYELVRLREDSLASQETQAPDISDSSPIVQDVHNLLNFAGTETQVLEAKRADFDEKIKIIAAKLERGVINLTEQDKQNLLRDIDKLEELLVENESRFNKNQQDYRELIETLRAKYFDIEALQSRLSQAEQERIEEQKTFRQQLLIGGIILIVFAILIVLLISFSGRMRRQAKQLKAANDEVKMMNENLEAIVEKRTQLLEESNRELDTFLYKASHDLRSPLRSILGLVNIKDHIPSQELMNRVTTTVEHMDTMLKKLISVSEIKRESENLRDLNITTIVEDVYKRFDSLIRNKNVQVHIDCTKDLMFRSNAVLIGCIVANLMENAILFSSMKHTDHARVEVTVKRDNGNLYITVYDNGVGIEESIRPKLFNMYFTGHEKSKGNGLGLYVVSKCVSVLFGTIKIDSEPDRYTKFSVELPPQL